MGDKTWAALFDNTKVKRVAGDFTCATELGEVLADPIGHFKARRDAKGTQGGDLDALLDRIAAQQRALGAQRWRGWHHADSPRKEASHT
jgi:hypothetical protein